LIWSKGLLYEGLLLNVVKNLPFILMNNYVMNEFDDEKSQNQGLIDYAFETRHFLADISYFLISRWFFYYFISIGATCKDQLFFTTINCFEKLWISIKK